MKRFLSLFTVGFLLLMFSEQPTEAQQGPGWQLAKDDGTIQISTAKTGEIAYIALSPELQAVLAEALRSRGIEPRLIEPRGAFLLVPHPDAMEMSRRLKDAGVNTDARPCPSGKTAHVRLCPDILNTEAELHRAAEIMAGLLAPR